MKIHTSPVVLLALGLILSQTLSPAASLWDVFLLGYAGGLIGYGATGCLAFFVTGILDILNPALVPKWYKIFRGTEY